MLSWPAGLATRQWRIQKADVFFFSGLIDFARYLCRGRRVIDDDCAVTDALQNTLIAENHGPDIGIITDTAEYDFRDSGGGGRSISYCPAMVLLPRLGFRSCPVVDRNFVAGTCKKNGHWVAHDTQPNERNTHFLAPVINPQQSYAALA
jgi:hypothetical protein